MQRHGCCIFFAYYTELSAKKIAKQQGFLFKYTYFCAYKE